MESYIIRVYRYEQQQNVAGTVQPIDQNEKYTFSTIEQLWNILQRSAQQQDCVIAPLLATE